MSLFGELRRRNVLRMGAAYAAVSWLIVQITETLLPVFGFGDVAIRGIVILLAAGVLPVLVFAWAFELTPEGLKRDRDVDRSRSIVQETGRRLDRVILVLLAVGLGYFAFDKFALSPQREAARAREQARELATATEAAREAGRTEAIVEAYGEKSIAVLPFADLSAEGGETYLGDGIAEELLTILAHYRDLRVISRTSSFALRDAGLSTTEVAAKLDVGHVLEGSVRRAGDRIRVTAQLIDARTDTHLWSQTYERELDDVFAIQDQVAAEVAVELKARLINAPENSTTDPATYDLYLQGLGLLARRNVDRLTEAVQLFERVTAQDPNFAPGHASLAQAHFWRGPPSDPELYPRIEASIDRALALDPDNSEALAVLGRVRLDRGQIAEGRALLRRAIERNPNNPLGYRWLGQSYATSNPAEYVALAHRAYLIDPLDRTIHWHRVTSLGLLGRTDEALRVADEARSFWSDDALNNGLAGDTHWRAGALDRAVMSYYLAYRADPDRAQFYQLIQACLSDAMEEPELAAAWREELEQHGGSGHGGIINLHQQGRTEEALKLAAESRRASPRRELYLAFLTLRFTHDLDRTRAHLEQGFVDIDQDPMTFDPDLFWVHYIDYALILQRAGEEAAATSLASQIETYFDRQIADGIEVAYTGDHLQFLYAKLHGARGDSAAVVAALARALREGHRCLPCLGFPHFDTVRADPAFVAVRGEYESTIAAQHRRLADAGMLLTPAEVARLEMLDFDPFAQ